MCFKGTPPQQWKAVTDYWQNKKEELTQRHKIWKRSLQMQLYIAFEQGLFELHYI